MKVLGLDISANATGAVVLEEGRNGPPRVLFDDELKPHVKARGMQRCSQVAGQMLDVLNAHKPDRVIIEGYGYASKKIVPIVEVGTVCRYFLCQLGYGEYLEIAPNALKKFVTGSGGAKKDQMILHVYKRWGYEAATDNLADAYGLACIGLAEAGLLLNLTAKMQEVLNALK